jgi:hypothetical protein
MPLQHTLKRKILQAGLADPNLFLQLFPLLQDSLLFVAKQWTTTVQRITLWVLHTNDVLEMNESASHIHLSPSPWSFVKLSCTSTPVYVPKGVASKFEVKR